MNRREEKRNLETIPVGSLGMIPLKGCGKLGKKSRLLSCQMAYRA